MPNRRGASALLLVTASACGASAAPAPRMHVARGVVSHVAGVWQIGPCGHDRSPAVLGDATAGKLREAHAAIDPDDGSGVYMELAVEPASDEHGPRVVAVRRAAPEADGCSPSGAATRHRTVKRSRAAKAPRDATRR